MPSWPSRLSWSGCSSSRPVANRRRKLPSSRPGSSAACAHPGDWPAHSSLPRRISLLRIVICLSLAAWIFIIVLRSKDGRGMVYPSHGIQQPRGSVAPSAGVRIMRDFHFGNFQEYCMKKLVVVAAVAVAGISLVTMSALRAQDSGQNSGSISLPADQFNAYQNATTQTDPAQKCAALRQLSHSLIRRLL